MSLMRVEHLGMQFGGLTAIEDLSFTLEAGKITAIIGPNGAGKTTLFNCITGFYRPTRGQIIVQHEGHDYPVHNMPGHAIVTRAGVARTFQNIRLLAGMSVLENLLVAQHPALQKAAGKKSGGLSLAAFFNLSSWRRREAEAVEAALYWLEQVGLRDRVNQNAGDLSYGSRRRLEIARALCTRPRLLCLDEPAAGLNPAESQELNSLLRALRDQHGVSLCLIEHDMSVVMEISDHVIVLDYGRKIADGSPNDIRQNPAVIAAYLGEPA